MSRYKISFEYLGSAFLGSQIQKTGKTVQGELTNALCTLTKNKNIKVIMAGRTDAGVSAKCQTAHFDTDLIAEKDKFLISLNALLPNEIKVFEIENVVASFHSQKSATFRHYQYKINNSLAGSVFDLNAYQYRLKFDINKMQKALNCLIGEHDFSAFKSVSDNPAKICNIYYANIAKNADYILIDIIGNRFLYNMVRAIVGTLFLIQTKNLDSSFMNEVLNSKSREKAGANVAPIGLTLIKTGYENPLDYVNKINERQINENL